MYKTIFIRNMISDSCIHLLKMVFSTANISTKNIKLGSVQVDKKNSVDKILDLIKPYGFSIITSKDQQLVESIKQCVVELVFEMNNIDSIVRKNEYLVEKTGVNYTYLSKVFSKNEPLTLEKYIILVKIERIKQLLIEDDYTLSEIAYMMDYNSVQYLSNQFKKITKVSVTDFKKNPINYRKSLQQLGF